MEIKYALLNPADGQYEMFITENEVKTELARRAISFYISHAHGVAYSVVTTDENGWETWNAKNNVSSIEELEIEKLIKEKL